MPGNFKVSIAPVNYGEVLIDLEVKCIDREGIAAHSSRMPWP
jgi:hypothetical protein